MCAKVIYVSYTCWATYSNQKTTPGQEVHKFYSFQALFLAYWGFQKYQTKVANFAPRTCAFCPPHCFRPGDAPDLSTNRARRQLTSLIEANTLTTTPDHHAM